MRTLTAVVATAGCLALAALGPQVAGASFPGANGQVAVRVMTSTPDGTFEHIFVERPDGSGAVDVSAVSDPTDAAHDTDPSWSPGGTMIAFASDRPDGIDRLWVMNGDGTGATQITAGAGSDPSWSPDGTRLVFVRDGHLWIHELVGGGDVQLTSGPGQDFAPAWSPDGRVIAFSRITGGFGSSLGVLQLGSRYAVLAEALLPSLGDFNDEPSWQALPVA